MFTVFVESYCGFLQQCLDGTSSCPPSQLAAEIQPFATSSQHPRTTPRPHQGPSTSCLDDCAPFTGALELPPGLGGRDQLLDPPGALDSYVYLFMSCYFDRDDVALKNFAKYFSTHLMRRGNVLRN